MFLLSKVYAPFAYHVSTATFSFSRFFGKYQFVRLQKAAGFFLTLPTSTHESCGGGFLRTVRPRFLLLSSRWAKNPFAPLLVSHNFFGRPGFFGFSFSVKKLVKGCKPFFFALSLELVSGVHAMVNE